MRLHHTPCAVLWVAIHIMLPHKSMCCDTLMTSQLLCNPSLEVSMELFCTRVCSDIINKYNNSLDHKHYSLSPKVYDTRGGWVSSC
ncbi:hypothetical protein BDQ94DRAFT_145046, partial [Aspergillus welwitschiae]